MNQIYTCHSLGLPPLTDEDDGGRVLLGLHKDLAQVALGLSCQLAHDLGAIDDDEEGTRLIGHSAGDQRLAAAGGAIEQNTLGRLDSDGLEQLGVAEGKLYQLADLGQLLADTTNIIVANLSNSQHNVGQK